MAQRQERTYAYEQASSIEGDKVRVRIVPDREQDRERTHVLKLTKPDALDLISSLQGWIDYFDANPARANAVGWPVTEFD